MTSADTLERNARSIDDIRRELDTLEPSAHASRDAIETAAGRIAETAATIAGGEYRPAYNGHVNRETWNASLWIDNDEGTYRESVAIVRRAFRDYERPTWRSADGRTADDLAADDRAGAISDAADALREWWDELNGPADASPLSDAWTYTIACVDWRAIADGIADGHSIELGSDDDSDDD